MNDEILRTYNEKVYGNRENLYFKLDWKVFKNLLLQHS